MNKHTLNPLVAIAFFAGACRTGPEEQASNEPFDPVGHTDPTTSKRAMETPRQSEEPTEAGEQAQTDTLETTVESVRLVFAGSLAQACGEAPRVHFEVDSAKVRDVAEDKLSDLARCLNEGPLEGDPITITGHADPRGTDEYNRSLGLDRANAVAQELVARGVDASRFDTYSLGEFLASEHPEDWDTDRRVVIRLDR
jgi:outer membrane protein OmpA-like peptidoglycan-associated protein